MEFNSTPFDRFDPFDSLALKPECWCNKTPFDHLTRLSRMESTRLHLIDLIHSTHLILSAQATRHHLTIWQGLVEWSPFDSIWSIWSWLTCFTASQLATRHHLTIWLGLVEWSPFDSIWSIWSIRLTCFTASQLMQQDTIWPFDQAWSNRFDPFEA